MHNGLESSSDRAICRRVPNVLEVSDHDVETTADDMSGEMRTRQLRCLGKQIGGKDFAAMVRDDGGCKSRIARCGQAHLSNGCQPRGAFPAPCSSPPPHRAHPCAYTPPTMGKYTNARCLQDVEPHDLHVKFIIPSRNNRRRGFQQLHRRLMESRMLKREGAPDLLLMIDSCCRSRIGWSGHTWFPLESLFLCSEHVS